MSAIEEGMMATVSVRVCEACGNEYDRFIHAQGDGLAVPAAHGGLTC